MVFSKSKYSGFYYGYHAPGGPTLKKALLLYDEIHIMDRPSFTIDNKFGSIAQDSPFRLLPQILSNSDINIICHEPHWGLLGGILKQPLLTSLEEDMNDRDFVNIFIDGLINDPIFSSVILRDNPTFRVKKVPFFVELGLVQLAAKAVAKGFPPSLLGDSYFPELEKMTNFKKLKYSRIQNSIINKDWSNVEFSLERLQKADPSAIVNPDSNEGIELIVNWLLCKASHMLNNFMLTTIETDSVPFTDLMTYHKLLAIKYHRASNRIPNSLFGGSTFGIIANTILDDILLSDNLKKRKIKDLLKYRKKHKNELIEFRCYLAELQHKIEKEPFDAEIEKEVSKLISLEVMPKAREYRERLIKSWENLFGSLAKSIGRPGWKAMTMLVLWGLPLDKLVTMGSIAALGAWAAPSVVDFIIERRKISRTNGLAYLLKI